MTVSVLGVVRACLVAGAATGLVLAATHADGAVDLGSPASGDARGSTSSAPVLAASVLCPGPEQRGVSGLDDVGTSASVAAVTAPDRVLGSAKPSGTSGSLALRGMPGGALVDPTTSRGVTATADVGRTSGVEVRGTGVLAPGLAATQTSLVTSGDHRGLVSTPCGEPGADLWLLAGGGAPGRQERLVLTNPGGNPVTADVTLHGPDGPLASAAGQGIVVPAHGRTAFLLDSISPDVASPAVHVVATGGVVGAVVNDAWLDGTRAAGSDDAVPAAPPSRDQVVPAVSMYGGGTLRIVVPGGAEAVVQARALTKDGPRALPRGGVQRMAGGSVHDIDLTGLPGGAVALQVRADQPVVAAAVVQRTGQSWQPSDFAWSSSTPPVAEVAGAPLAAPPGGTGITLRRGLALTASGGPADVEVVTVDGSGAATSKRLTVAPDSTVSSELGGAVSVWVHRLSGSGRLRAGVVTTGSDAQGGYISVLPLRDTVLRSTSLAVREAPPG